MSCFVFTSCNPYALSSTEKKAPYNFPNTKWTSTSPDMYFIVDENGYNVEGKIILEDEEIDFSIRFNNFRPEIYIYSGSRSASGEKYSLSAKCKFSVEKCIVTIDKKTDKIFDKSVKKITFIREDLTPEEVSEYFNS